MSVVNEDLVSGARGVITAERGIVITRIFFVSELTGAKHAKIFNALTAPGIPRSGEAHPSTPFVRVASITAAANDNENATVTVVYQQLTSASQPPDETQQPIIQVGTTVQRVTTNVDIGGDPLKAFHTKVEFDPDTLTFPETLLVQIVEAEVERPSTTLRFSRRESESPVEKAKKHVGTENFKTFVGDPRGFWLCTGITGTSNDGGVTYDVSYEFQRLFDLSDTKLGWAFRAQFIDEDTGEPTRDFFTDELDKTEYFVYKGTDFNELNLGI